MVSGDGPCALLELSPAWLIALPEVLGRSVWVCLVTQGEHRGTVDAADELGGCLVALPCAVSYVARRDDDIPGRWSRGPLGSAAKGEEYRQERHDEYRRASTGSDASEHLPGFHGDIR